MTTGLLGGTANNGHVWFVGEQFEPTYDCYLGVDTVRVNFFSEEDSGAPCLPEFLSPLIAAALYESAFAWEAGALSTWVN